MFAPGFFVCLQCDFSRRQVNCIRTCSKKAKPCTYISDLYILYYSEVVWSECLPSCIPNKNHNTTSTTNHMNAHPTINQVVCYHRLEREKKNKHKYTDILLHEKFPEVVERINCAPNRKPITRSCAHLCCAALAQHIGRRRQ